MWKQDSILANYSEHTPCKDIFQAVCDLIGDHYQNLDWKYARSRPKITFKDKQFKMEVAFWSSGYNTPGDYVNLEIIPAICSLELIKHYKEQGESTNGYILGMMDFYHEKSEEVPAGIRRVINIDGKTTDLEEGRWPEGVLSFNKNINVYGITPELLEKIISFIDQRIVIWLEAMNNLDLLISLIDKLPDSSKKELKQGAFYEFLKLEFPENLSDIDEVLC
ncbi:MAG: hypothetical protein HUJ25_13050 [Crocinitomicaceae bacterium]|nr:hypothetical protein [Crocinitomicaceae bacterium]